MLSLCITEKSDGFIRYNTNYVNFLNNSDSLIILRNLKSDSPTIVILLDVDTVKCIYFCGFYAYYVKLLKCFLVVYHTKYINKAF